MRAFKLIIVAGLFMWTTNANAGHCTDVCKVWVYNYNAEIWTYQTHDCNYAHSIADSLEDVEYQYNTCYNGQRYYTYRGHRYWRRGRHYQRRYYRGYNHRIRKYNKRRHQRRNRRHRKYHRRHH